MPAVFVTAAGTDIGKTYVTAALVRRLRARGTQVDAYKPVASGFDERDFGASDAAELLLALGREVTLAEIIRINPWRFSAPLSPDMAARREHSFIAFDTLIAWTRAVLAARNAEHWTFVEGVGGALVPLDDHRTVANWFEASRAPALLVGGSYLGAISHTLCAHEVLLRRGRVAAIVVNESPESPVPLEETAATIARFCTAPVIALARSASPSPLMLDAILAALEAANGNDPAGVA
ncbi:MAG: dethiobiotin synthase [Candidatus Velthaea sp.]